ncbi:MAG: DUF547 domain-containing protein [Thermodesulfobacteriota bacterium]|nr:DUF547 domain-containing protein [Thermodesulfobacteriota bacterium]
MKQLVLNASGERSPGGAGGDIARQLKSKIDGLKLDFFDVEKGDVDYHGLKNSAAFQEYKAATRGLVSLDPRTLTTREARLAFWINLYNALVVHGILALDIRKSVKEVRSFFQILCYNVGGYVFSLDDMEHGILRGNKKRHLLARRPFLKGDPRHAFAIQGADPRIHFALVCGSNSCPPIAVYEEGEIDEQLDLVSEAFVNSDEVTIKKEEKVLRVSRIFKWYKRDFGGREGLLSFLIKYRFSPEEKAFVKEVGPGMRIVYNTYDWSLNLV